MTKASYGLGPLMTDSPDSWYSWMKSLLLVTSCLRSPVYLANKMHTGMAETRKKILIGHTTMLSRQNKTKENLIQLCIWMLTA